MGIFNRRIMAMYLLLGMLLVAGEVSAKNLYVSPTGSDAVSYTGNDINHPWATPLQAWTYAQAGDNVYFRGGTYTISSQIWTKFYGNNGTASSPIIFQSYPGERATFNSNVDIVFVIERNFNHIKNIDFTGNASMWFKVGYDVVVDGFKISQCSAIMGSGGDNRGFVQFSVRSTNAIIERCKIVGPGLLSQGIHGNTAGIILFRATSVKLLNNEISNAPIGIYFKHANASLPADTNIEIAYNYIDKVDRHSIFLNSNYAYVHDNVIGVNAAGPFKLNEANGFSGGNGNIINHNTVGAGAFAIFCDDNLGLDNTVTNNIFMDQAEYHRYCAILHDTVLNNNLYPASNVILENRIAYSLAGWRTYYQRLAGHGGDESRSVAGTPTWVGGANPAALAGYALAAGSLGKNAATDGKDLGANIAWVGVGGGKTLPAPPVLNP